MARIMIIEDDKAFNEVLSAVLEEAGHECHVEETAVNIYRDVNSLQSFDVIILDLMMPKEGELLNDANGRLAAGEILFRCIRETFNAKQIIVITAKDRNNINMDINSDSNTFIILKPVDDDAINLILNKIG